METLSLSQLQEIFAALRQQTQGAIDAEQPWSYFFSAPNPETLEALSLALEALHFEGDEIDEDENESRYYLELTRVEAHTPESLFALNAELEAAAARHEGAVYEGMDIASGKEHECCGGHGGEGCCGGHGHGEEEEHECCGGKGGDECCGGKGHGHGEEEGCCGKHYHGANEPIENPELLTAIETIKTDRSPNAQQALTLALQRGLYLIPALASSESTQEEGAVQLLVCTDEQNNEFLPLFTDEAALKTWTHEAVSAMVMTAPEAWEFILNQPRCAGGVINPGSANLPLNREMVQLLKKMIDGK